MKKIRVGVVGMGIMGYAHARIYNSLPYVELVGCVEVSESKRKSLTGKLPCPIYSSTKELYSKGIDAVSICTPDYLHEDAVIEAFSHKIKVLVEKPLAVTVASAQNMLDAQPDDTYLMVGHDLHFDTRVIGAKRDILAGKLGNIRYIRTNRSSSIPLAHRVGGGTSVTWFLGIHDIELVLWLTGLKVKKVESALGVKYVSPNWDCVSALIEMENGSVWNLATHWIYPGVHSQESDSIVKIFGDKGVAEISLLKNEYSFTPNDDNGRQKFSDTHYQPDDLNDVPSGDLYNELVAFMDAVMNNKIPSITGKDAFEAVKVVERIEEILESTGVNIQHK